ncbi:bifunctional DNA primase/polymerase [Micromonospora sp. WMMA1363]|uniref:bifunctional DNA primase/polymerase n=1 Tax=Micromonospora sp. WMMA1363 TaxID=3053985 RepID=UPI00259CE262|nr:bifunctional DNA primase/polymerase [Micromonospora sp. WMMA1363]MDM4721328.1 bifunctional DNA primase/polymerase [Micromonospora sp. WMMA1363]
MAARHSRKPPARSLLTAAIDYAAHGWPVFMLARSKRPLAGCERCDDKRGYDGHDRDACPCLTCHGFYAATTDPDRITAMVDAAPRGQLALRTGTASDVVVLDVDPRNGGRRGLATLVADGLVPRTAYVITGSDGLHLFYRHPGTPLAAKVPGVPGIDIKTDGGYVVLPPSIHQRTGRPYRWADRGPVQEMPPALATVCQPAPPPTIPTTPTPPVSTRSAGGISHPDLLLASHLDAVARAPEGHRRTTLYGASRGVARMILAHAINKDDGIAALTTTGRNADQTDRDIRAAIRGGFRDEGLAA